MFSTISSLADCTFLKTPTQNKRKMRTQTAQKREQFACALRNNTLRVFAITALFFGLLSLALYQPSAIAATPTLNFQARLENGSGAIAPDGVYNVEFKLYQGGTSAGGGTLKWTEDWLNSASNGVRVANGYLTVNLGSITSFPTTINWDADLYLSMNIGGTGGTATWDGEMSPYLKLTSVPYAFQAKSAEQLQIIQGSYTGTLGFNTLTANRNLLLPDESGTLCTITACTGANGGSGNASYIWNGTSLQSGANFYIDGVGKAGTFNATTALQTGGVTRIDSSGNLVNIGNVSGSGTLQLSGTTGSSYIMSALGLGTMSPQAGSVLTIANASWITGVDSAGTGYINMFQVNANDEIQVGAALNIDGGIVLPTDGGQMTFSDLPISSAAAAGTAQSYTLRVGSSNVLTVYGQADGSGNAQNLRVAIGSSISPAYTLDVGGDGNFTGDLYGNGKQILRTNDAFLRINQSNTFTSGIWLGSSILRAGYGGVYLGSTGGDGQIALLSTSGDTTRRITMTGSAGNINITGAYQINGVNICTSGGCTSASGSGNYIQNGTSVQSGANFNISGSGTIGTDLTVTGAATFNGGVTVASGKHLVLTNSPVIEGGAAGATRIYRNLANYEGNTDVQAGAIVIHTGVPPSNQMSVVNLRGYKYTSNGAGGTGHNINIDISGYWYTANTWPNSSYHNYGDVSFSQVRFGLDASGNVVIILGATTDTWSYPKLYVDHWLSSHTSGNDAAGDNWSITQETDISSYTSVATVGEQTYLLSDTRYAQSSGSGNYIQNGTTQQTSANFNIDGTGTSGTFNATTALQTASTTRIDAVGNLTNIGTYSGSGNITTTGGVLSVQGAGNSYFAGNVGIGNSSPTAKLQVAYTGTSAVGLQIDNTVPSGTTLLSLNSDSSISTGSYFIQAKRATTSLFSVRGDGTGTFAGSLSVGGVGVFSATGILQNSAVSGSYSGITGVGTLTNLTVSGAITSTVATGTAPLAVSSTTMVANLNVEMVNGYTATQLAENLRANHNMTGGGTVSFDGTNIKWTSRFIVISNGRGSNFGTSGFFDITMPTSGTITGVGGATNATATASGVPLSAWQALYYILPIGSTNVSNAANFRIAAYTTNLDIPSEWVLVAIRNGDNGTVKFSTGDTLASGQSSTAGSATQYIQNSTSVQAGANFNISGSGTIGTNLSVAGTLGVTGAATLSSTLNVLGDISGNSKIAIRTGDTWLRLNPTGAFTAGIYTGGGVFRSDGTLQVGASGATLNVASGGNFTYGSNTLFANTSGNVGIGTASPGAKLDVAGATRITTSATSALLVQDAASNALLNADTSSKRITLGSGTVMSTTGYLSVVSYGAASYSYSPSFATRTDYAASRNGAYAVTSADVDGDGNVDMVGGFYDSLNSSGGLRTYLNNGDGTFTSKDNIAFGSYATYGGVQTVVSGDLNGDGAPDFVGTTSTGYLFYAVNPNGPSAYAASPTTYWANYTGGNNPKLVDIDHDGDLDIISMNGSQIVALKNNGSGTFTATFSSGSLSINSFDVGDVNGDGYDDVIEVTSDYSPSPNVVVMINNGTGSFTQSNTYYPYPANIYYASLADLDKDGDLDLVAYKYQNAAYQLMTMINNGSGAFSSPTAYSLSNNSVRPITGDVNGDGYADVVLASNSAGSYPVSVFMNDGTGNLLSATTVTTASYSWGGAALADVNRDSKLDLLLAATSGPAFYSVMLNNYTSTLPPTSTINSSTASQNAKLQVVADATNGGALIQGSATGTSNLLTLQTASGSSLMSVTSTGAATFRSDTDSTTSFQIQSSSGASLFSTDTTNKRISIGGAVNAVDTLAVPGTGIAFTSAPDTYTSYNPTYATETGDLDGDGDVDIVAASNGKISIYKNNGDGTYAAKVDYTGNAIGSAFNHMALADLNGDGNPDIIEATNSSAIISVFLNNGAGAFSTKTDLVMPNTPTFAVVAADLDGDGDKDIAASSGTKVSVFLNNGSGSFGTKVDYTGTGTLEGLDAADIDSDGDADLVALNVSGTMQAQTFLNNGNGTFGAAVNTTISATASSGGNISLTNVDGDGDKDLVIVDAAANVMSVMTNNGSGTFSGKVDYTVGGTSPYNLKPTDFDGDGDMDFLIGLNSGTYAQILLNDGTGAYMTRIARYIGTAPVGIGIGDVNADGKADFVVGNSSTLIRVYLNTTVQTVTGGTTGATLSVKGSNGSDSALTLQAASNQTAKIFVIQNSAGARLLTVDGQGNLNAAGTITGGVGAPDYAENIGVSDLSIEAADVVTMDPDRTEWAVKATTPYDAEALGVISTNPGFLTNSSSVDKPSADEQRPLALSGRVPVKVSTINGPIHEGDYLTSSIIPGYAMKATAEGQTVGRAMAAFNDGDGVPCGDYSCGKVLMFIDNSYYNPADGTHIQGADLSVTGNGAVGGGLTIGGGLNVGGFSLLSNLEVAGSAEVKGDLTVVGTTNVASIIVGVHILSKAGQPQIKAGSAVGQDGRVTIDGTDTAGSITIIVDAHQPTVEEMQQGIQPEILTKGDLADVTFSKIFEFTPRIALSPTNETSVGAPVYIVKTEVGYRLVITQAAINGATYRFDYIIIGSAN